MDANGFIREVNAAGIVTTDRTVKITFSSLSQNWYYNTARLNGYYIPIAFKQQTAF